MSNSENISELSKALAKVHKVIKHPIKNCSNPFHKNKYADLLSVIDSINNALKESDSGLTFTQTVVSGGATLRTVTSNGINQKSGETFNSVSSYPLTILRTMIMHESGEYIISDCPIIPVDTTPQAYGAALTYFKRYTLSTIFGIASDEDTDGESSQRSGNHNKIAAAKASLNNNNVVPLTQTLSEMDRLSMLSKANAGDMQGCNDLIKKLGLPRDHESVVECRNIFIKAKEQKSEQTKESNHV